MTEPVCVACTTNPQRVGVLCAGCYHRTDDALFELAERWGLMRAALLEPGSQPEQRVSGSREFPLPGGEALNLTGPANVAVAERTGWVPAWRSTADVTRPADGLCTAEHATVRCCLGFGHVRQHRRCVECTPKHDGPAVRTWPHQQATWRREPILDPDGRQKLTPPGDQLGDVNPTEVLWSWVRDWLTYRTAGETGPTPDLPNIITWLRHRLDWAAQHHPAVDDFAAEVHHMTTTLRRTLNVARYVQRFKEPCPRCDTVALYRELDPTKDPTKAWVKCGACGNLWYESEFARLGVILDDEARRTT